MAGAGSGHIFEMIARIKANEALRKKKSYFKSMQDYKYVTGGQKLSFRTASKEQLEEIRYKIKLKRRRELRITVAALLFAMALTFGLAWGVLKLLHLD